MARDKEGPKALANRMKQKGLTRLRWYCQPCQRGMRDENAFKQHTLSESHVRQMAVLGEDPKKAIQGFSDQFVKDFIGLLKTSHGDKKVHLNQFYQEYIANKEHLHMNATKWSSLTEFAKYLGKEGLCRVEEDDKGLYVSWIDTSPAALRRQEALKRRAALDQGDEALERRLLEEQIRRAEQRKTTADPENTVGQELRDRADGETFVLTFGPKKTPSETVEPTTGKDTKSETTEPTPSSSPTSSTGPTGAVTSTGSTEVSASPTTTASAPAPKVVMKLGTAKPLPKNVFAQKRKELAAAAKKKAPPTEAGIGSGAGTSPLGKRELDAKSGGRLGEAKKIKFSFGK